jgi:hypothetical protein
VVPSFGVEVVVLSNGVAAAGINLNLLSLPSSNQTSPTAPPPPLKGLSFSLDASLFPWTAPCMFA